MKFLDFFIRKPNDTIDNGSAYRDMSIDTENGEELMIETNDNHRLVKFTGLSAEGDIGIFLNDNEKYYHYGRKNGQLYGSVDSLENAKKDIVAKFQRLVTKSIDGREDEVAQMNMHIEAFPPNENQLKPKMNVLTLEINKLKEQIELSEKFEGWVKSNIASFENGFIKGKNENLARLF